MSSDTAIASPTESAEEVRKESEEQLSLLQAITREVATAANLSAALKIVLRHVCEETGWQFGAAWLPNKDRTALECDSVWAGSATDLKEFSAVTEQMEFKRGVGLPGRVWKSKTPAWVEDITNDPNFPRAPAAKAAGLRTGVGIPILSGDKAIAMLEFFMRDSRRENEHLMHVITAVAGQLDLLRRATAAEAEARERQFQTLANSISQLAWMADHEGYIFWYNDRWYDYTGTTLEEMKGWGWQRVHHPDEVARVVERIKVAFTTGQPWEDTFPLRSKAGEYRWFLSRALPIFDSDGKVVRWFGTNTDITEQRELERALRESRDQLEQKVTDRTAELSRTNEILRSILSNMGDGVIVADKDGNFLVFNPAAERMFGNGATAMPTSNWSQRYGLFLPDKTTPFPHDQLPMIRSIRGEEVDNIEMFVRHEKVQHGLWTRITGRPLYGSNGDLLGGVTVCRDITEVKEEELFREGQSHVLEMIAADKPLGAVLESLVLLMEGQAEGLRCSILLLGRDGKHVQHGAAPHLPETYVKAVNGAPIGPRNGSCGTAMYLRQRVVVTDVMTDPLWADYRELARICGLSACWSSPIISAQGDVLGSFAMYREEKRGPHPEEERLTDVATHIAGIAIERQRQQETLREREARISLAAESADLAFWSLFPEQNGLWMSAKGRAIYGFAPDARLTCDAILSRVHPDERAKIKAEYDSACAIHGKFESEHRLLLPYGKVRWVIMRGRCIKDDEGKIIETIGVTVDVSAQKQADLQLQVQREEMAHRNRVSLMGEMTASFAHELNQPLAAIANNAAAARRFIERGKIDPALLQEILQALIADSRRAGEVIQGIRNLVRKDTSVHTRLNLNAIIEDTVRLVGTDILSRESVVTTELDPQLPQVNAAPVQIQQILLNLIMNALDASEALKPSERRINIKTRSDQGDVAEVTVRDFGVGLPQDRPDKIFDHFFSTKQKGMGMGLTIVRSIVEAHGGTIAAENAPDRGARIIVRLPAARGEVERNKAAA
ncbi:MAG TPA: PAS domain S-box protein [Chthoniobacterales bacterium]|nr:PAS domain S-box protein [Chthoniobacterales bacterium]